MKKRALILLWLALVAPTWAQSRLTFMVAECYVHKLDVPITAKDREEKRYYVSALAVPPADLEEAQLPKLAARNFEADVLDPLVQRQLSVKSLGDNIQVYGAEKPFKTDAEALESRTKVIEALKASGGNIYTFDWTVTMPKVEVKETKTFGEEEKPKTQSKSHKVNPKLFFRDDKQPHYEGKDPSRLRDW